MRFNIDESLPIEVAQILRNAGHDAATVNDEAEGGASDPHIAALLRRELTGHLGRTRGSTQALFWL